jgi:hypothetical protein
MRIAQPRADIVERPRAELRRHQLPLAVLSVVLTLLNVPLIAEVKFEMTVTNATITSATITAYSTAVGPSSLTKNR